MSTRFDERMWRCDCGGEALGVTFYVWRDDPPDWFIEVYKTPGLHTWRWRFKQCANLLLGREVVIDAVSLDKEKVAGLLALLRESIAAVTPPPEGTYTGNSPTTSTLTVEGK